MILFVASTPTCGSNATNPMPENNVASSSCNVSYYNSPTGGPTANMTWSAGCTESSVTSTTAFYSSSATVIAQRETLQSCNCTTRFKAPSPQPDTATNSPSYSFSCSSPSNIPVSCKLLVTLIYSFNIYILRRCVLRDCRFAWIADPHGLPDSNPAKY